MNKPIEAGDECLVVGGLGRHKSPNLGLKVRVISRTGEHSQHGIIWRCRGEGIQQLNDGGGYDVTGEADFAVGWLQKVDGVKPGKTTEATRGVTA